MTTVVFFCFDNLRLSVHFYCLDEHRYTMPSVGALYIGARTYARSDTMAAQPQEVIFDMLKMTDKCVFLCSLTARCCVCKTLF